MSMGKPTPGRFRVHYEGRSIITIEDEHGEDIAMMCPRDGRGEERANARMLAAAPAMLAALRRAKSEAVADEMDGWFADAVAAIAEAEGRS